MDKIKIWAQKALVFLKEARMELRKVTWPTPKQALASTAVVIVVVFVVSSFLGIVDFGLTKLVKLLLG
ncbi:MAG TPA: preprotein translocase subunit SecE [Syntrophales bacterium]|nr:preprotein translocase subunit SecE [Syntrophales bacterium]HOM06755.1 preprotein translocase subunit SecE [Syntrophales bacterium]HON99550.1 preprotein translocase subunit SecE [Syntrophales bacterium]HPC00715.1 preprotein translocase subunit SecE [Syntrophales bacterium]HPQ06087.1 preprotein translocase subunit SecE [Syntrophales bacterium]